MQYKPSNSSSTRLILVAVSLAAIIPGCVRRRMTVRTNPSGAMVYVDHQSIGTTPVSTNFVYYGTRQFEVIKDGYRTEKFLRRIDPPWYEWPVLDFFSESVWPFEKRDERIIDVQLTPDVIVPTDALIRSGEELRSQASRGFAVSPPPTAGGLTAAEAVIPSGPVPFSTSPPIFNAPVQAPNLPNPPNNAGTFTPFFDVPPASIPATNVAPGSSYRQNLDKP